MTEEPRSRPAPPVEVSGRREKIRCPRWEVFAGAVCVLLAYGVLVEHKLWRPDHRFTIRENVQIAEAQAWWAGRMELPERKWDTALRDGRVYSHFPPMFSIIAACVVPFSAGVPHGFIVLGLILPVLLLSYALFLRRTGSGVWGALLAIGLVFGTSAFPVLDKTLYGASPYFVNQTLATIGLLIMLLESFGRRRVGVLGVGLVLSALSRQLTLAYAIPLVYVALHGWSGEQRVRRITALALTLFVVVAVPCTLNTIKFGHPLDSGYMDVYTDRPEDDFSRDARAYGIFSAHYVPRNLYYANLGFPKVYRIEMAGEPEIHLRPNRMGTGIWWTTPLLLWLFVDFRRIVRDGRGRAWLAAAVLAAGALMFYHSTGSEQRGFNRYSLDYVPVLLALVAPYCVVGRRRWASVAMIGWSVLYFRWLI